MKSRCYGVKSNVFTKKGNSPISRTPLKISRNEIKILRKFDLNKNINSETEIQKAVSLVYPSAKYRIKFRPKYEFLNIINALIINRCYHFINGSKIELKHLESLFYNLGFKIKNKIVESGVYGIVFIVLREYEEICPKCNGSTYVKLYEYGSEIPVMWSHCFHCVNGRIDFIDKIKGES